MSKYNRKIMLNIALSLILALILGCLAFRYTPFIMDKIKSPERFRAYLLSFGDASIFVFIAFQMLQVLIAAIPGEVVQVAGGYVYGTLFGAVYSIVGILIGSVGAFAISRLVGYSLVRKLVSASVIERFEFLINSKRAEVAMFVLFLIPGIPKDMLTYIAGLAPIHPLSFLGIAMVARIPGILASTYIGANLQKGNYVLVILASVVVVAVAVLAVIYREKVISRLKNLRH